MPTALTKPSKSCEVVGVIFNQWNDLMVTLRQVEKRCMVEREPSPKDLENHKGAVNAMIFCADAIASTAQRFIETNCHIEESDQISLRQEIELLQRHRKILAFEFNGWHGLNSCEQLEGL